ncbi:MAG TPA: hypothetical protein VN369_01470 [Terriglobales bacterium]|nr:hypothetical protein [Terriglobales bacterium]
MMYPEKFKECVDASGSESPELALMYKLAINLGARLELGSPVFDDEEDVEQQPVVFLDGYCGGIEAIERILGVSRANGTLVVGEGEKLTRAHGFEKVSGQAVCLELRDGVRELETKDVMKMDSPDLFKPVKPTLACPKVNCD